MHKHKEHIDKWVDRLVARPLSWLVFQLWQLSCQVGRGLRWGWGWVREKVAAWKERRQAVGKSPVRATSR